MEPEVAEMWGRMMRRGKPRADIDIYARKPWLGAVWHHSTARDGTTYDWEAVVAYHTSHKADGRAVDAMEYEKLRIQQRGKRFETPMAEVGFHFCVEYEEREDGVFVPAIRQGRSLEKAGEHASHRFPTAFDQGYIGLLAVGNFDAKPVRPEMWDTCLRLTRSLMDAFAFGPEMVIGHCEADGSVGEPRHDCPGALWDLAKFRKDL